MTWYYNGSKIEESDIYDIVESQYTDEEHISFINEIEEPITIFGIKYDVGTILKKVDPIVFDESKNEEIDYIVSEIINSYGDMYDYYGIEWIE